MTGINAISMISMYSKSNGSCGEQKLTAATKAKLSALGVDTTGIKTEAEGRMKLLETQATQTSSTKSTKKTDGNNSTLEEAKALAAKLNIYVSDADNIDDIVYKITNKINEMKNSAGDDFDKQSDVNYYMTQLDSVEKSQISQLELTASMNLTANMNIAFHGLY